MEIFNTPLNRRQFITSSGAGAGFLMAGEPLFALLKPIVTTDNPLDYYPSRDW